jgi:glycosyltransferase involved in cell wall biosynthesis
LTTKSYGNIYKISQKSASREQKYIELHKNIIGRTDWDRRITSILSPGRSYFHNDEVLRDSFYEKQWRPKRDLDLVIIHSTIGSNYFKGLESILLASYLLTKYGLKHQWKVAGVVKNDLIVKISKKYLNIPSIDRSIIYLGNISELDLVENLLNSHIYVMPSHIENSPNNLCEAMILGMPCISTNAGGSSSLITDKVDGLLIQNGDPWSMAGAIVEFCEDFDKAIDYGKKARIRALQRHSKEKIVRDLLEIYKNCLKQ